MLLERRGGFGCPIGLGGSAALALPGLGAADSRWSRRKVHRARAQGASGGVRLRFPAILAALALLPAALAAELVDVDPTGDAEGELLAVSGTGRARSFFLAASVTGDAESCFVLEDCVSVSGTGNATGRTAVSGTGAATSCSVVLQCIAVSGTGPANGVIAWSGANRCTGGACADAAEGDARAHWFAVSKDGNATTRCFFPPCAAASVHGRALSWAAVSVFGPALGAVAASGTGDASGQSGGASLLGSAQGGALGVSPLGRAGGGTAALSVLGPASSGFVALSVAGDANGPNSLSLLGACGGVRCFAIEPDGDDADARWLGVSLFGNSSGAVSLSGTGDAGSGVRMSILGTCAGVRCVAVEPDGPADGDYAGVSATGPASGFVGASGTGPAQGDQAAASGTGAATSILAVSGTGPARADGGAAAISLLGPAHGSRAASVLGEANGSFLAVSPAGDARSDFLPVGIAGSCNGFDCAHVGLGDADAFWVAVTPDGDATGLLAVSGEGDATTRCLFVCLPAASLLGDASSQSALAASGLGDAQAGGECMRDLPVPLCIAASGGGDATSCPGFTECIAASGAGDATGFVAVSLLGDSTNPTGRGAAVSGTGEADGDVEVSGCETIGVCA